MRHRAVALAGFATGALAGTTLYRRWAGSKRERLELYFDDGSFVTLADGSPDAARLLPLAQQVVTAARP
ncbi:MAG TPA: hypothetical protein VGH46_09015 [Gaiellaceae bacterium]|jgi:hypothetical protein